MKLRGDLILVTTVDEEIACNGALAVVERGYRADGVAAVDGGGPGRPIVAFPGMLGFRVLVYGRQTAYNQADGVSAIEKASLIFSALSALESQLNRMVGLSWHGHPDPVDVLVSHIEGGEWISVVPGKCVLEGFVTYVPPLTERDVRSALEAAIQSATRDDAWLAQHPPRIELGALSFPPFDASSDNAVLETLGTAFLAIHGRPIVKRAAPAFSDLFHLSRAGGSPGCLISPGTGGNPHTADEYYELDTMRPATKVLLAFVLDWCGVAP